MPLVDPELFTAGVTPGGLYNRRQIRLLLCLLALRLSEPLTLRQAEQCFMEEGLANYFEFRAALEELLQEGQLTAARENGEAALRLPAELRAGVEDLAREIPKQAMDRALHRAAQIQEAERRERDNQISVYPLQAGGYLMTFRQGSGSEMLMSVTLYQADRAQVERTRQAFLEAPGKLYAAVLGAFAEEEKPAKLPANAGALGEDYAARFLESRDCRILERNYRIRQGEIDLIAEAGEYLLFVEVKTRKAGAYICGEEAVDAYKQGRLRTAAEHYLSEHGGAGQPRFDVLCVEIQGQVCKQIRWLKDAFH
ncbi:MAG: YraN family protein [Oscillospiraceae bacterium]|jgi:putative endonuclease|nr:YraN family protein [Oscillospiraceae bacterium]